MKIFISHSWRDKEHAESLAKHLGTSSEVWMDYRNLRAGDDIQAEIDSALHEIDLVLVIWSSNGQESDGVGREVETALRLKNRIVPCIFEYDDDGLPVPPLSGPLSRFLAVDFHHFNGGVVELMKLVHELTLEKHPEIGMQDDPRLALLQDVQSYMKYLAQYRSAQGGNDERAKWVKRIVDRLRAYIEETGDQQVAQFLYVAASDEGSDPEGIAILRTGLEDLLPGIGGQTNVLAGADNLNHLSREQDPWPAPRAVSPQDQLLQQIALAFPQENVASLHIGVKNYLGAAPIALDAMSTYAMSVGSSAGMRVTNLLKTYLIDDQDLIPDHLGDFGLIDDAWLILNTAFRLVESGVIPVQNVPIDWQTVVQADYIVRAILPPQVLTVLEHYLMQVLNLIAAEIQAYQPWMTPAGHGYSPFLPSPASSGGSWEDQMNDALLGTGLSV